MADVGTPGMDTLAALEEREHQIEVFLDCEQQAREYLAREGSDKLVAELRGARAERRRMRLGTPNTLILLDHIDRLEARLTEPYRG